jgi:hypothetical protein
MFSGDCFPVFSHMFNVPVYILSHLLVAIDGIWIGDMFSDLLQGVTINNYNSTSDFHTTNYSALSSQPNFTSFYLVTALHNSYSVDVSWYIS